MSISEKLLTLNETKQAIKTAIEDKGQDLTDVPFIRYASKIAEIAASSRRFTKGTVTFTITQTKQVVTHNLGVIPNFIVMYPKDLSVIPESGMPEVANTVYKFMQIYSDKIDINIGFSNQVNPNTFKWVWGATNNAANAYSDVNETTFTTGATGTAYKYPADIEFEWIAFELEEL